jgi:predicted lipoprotein
MPVTSSFKRRLLIWAGVLVGFGLLSYFLPLFHVVPLQAARQQSAVFDTGAFVEKFWNTQLLPAQNRAVDANELLEAFRENPKEAVTRFGHRLGLSSTAGFFVSGNGTIVAVEDRSVSIALNETGEADVLIETGPVFGNTVRDGSGLLDVNDFPNSRDFNAISSEINRRVEERVFPILKEKAVKGVSVQFAGCVDIADPETDLMPLRLVPIMIKIP